MGRGAGATVVLDMVNEVILLFGNRRKPCLCSRFTSLNMLIRCIQ